MVAIQQQQPAVNGKALIWTIGVHCLLFLLFFLARYTTQIPPPVTEVGGGLEVNLGTSNEGGGKDQPMNTKAPAPYQATVVYKAAATKSAVSKEIVQTNQADAPELNSNPKKTKGQAAMAEPGHKQEKPKYTYEGEHGEGGNSATQNKPGRSEGNDHGPGDKGVTGGTPGAPNYSGTPGNGMGGIGHTLTGRSISPSVFEAEFSESGKVIIHVTVDRNGNIVNRTVKSSSSPQLTRLALEKLNSVKFSKSDSPEPQQFGDVTIIFKTRQ